MTRRAGLQASMIPDGPAHGGRDFETFLADALRKAEAAALGRRANPESHALPGPLVCPGGAASWGHLPIPAASRPIMDLALIRSARLAYAAATQGSADLFKSPTACRR